MIKIENIVTPSPEQWEAVIRGMRNPKNSWDHSDSGVKAWEEGYEEYFDIGEEDMILMERLVSAGTDHRKFMRMIPVYMDITAPLYWWKEYDTYKVGTVANSCSTMHKIHAKEFSLEDFSSERMDSDTLVSLMATINVLEKNRVKYIETKDVVYWDNMIQLLPTSYNQRRTAMLNYEVLRNMYRARKKHKLPEWREFCVRIKTLPYHEFITGCIEW